MLEDVGKFIKSTWYKEPFTDLENYLWKNKTEAGFDTWVAHLPESDDSPIITRNNDGVGGLGYFDLSFRQTVVINQKIKPIAANAIPIPFPQQA